MLRVALVIDDYNELIYLQTLLKKIGFDVEGLQNPKKYPDVSLGFNPHILITTAKGKKVDGLLLAQSVHRRRGLPKVLALQTPGAMVSADEQEACGIDLVIDSPVNVKKLLMGLSSLGNIDEVVLLEKYAKIVATLNSENNSELVTSANYEYDENGQIVTKAKAAKEEIESIFTKPLATAPVPVPAPGAVKSSMTTKEDHKEREQRFSDWLKNMEPLVSQNFDRERILDFNKMIRSAQRAEDIQEVEDERKKFVRALFKK